MKKFYLIFAAMAVMFSANATVTGGSDMDGERTFFFDKDDGNYFQESIYEGLFGPKDIHTIAFAISDDDALMTWLAGAPSKDGMERALVVDLYNNQGAGPANNWVPVVGAWYGNTNANNPHGVLGTYDNRKDARLTKLATKVNVGGTNMNIFYIDVYPKGLFKKTIQGQSWAAIADQAALDYVAGYIGDRDESADGFTATLVNRGFLLLAASVFGSEFVSETGLRNPDLQYTGGIATAERGIVLEIKFGGDLVANPDLLVEGSGIMGWQGINVGIADVIADEQGADVVGYFSILGAKLPGEPASGIYLVKLSNGKTLKLVK